MATDAGTTGNVAVIGGDPAGLSTVLFAAKNGLDTTLFDTDEGDGCRPRIIPHYLVLWANT